VHTKVDIKDLKYIVKSMMSYEFILQFSDGIDLRLTLEDREDLMILLKMRFVNVCPDIGLKLYGIKASHLKEFKNNSKSQFENEPDDQFRLRDEEIACQKEFEKTAEKVEQDPNDFDFKNRKQISGKAGTKPDSTKIA